MSPLLKTLLRFAWKDGWRHWRHGLLFVLTLLIGLGTLATIRFYAETARSSLELRTRELLGSDLLLQSNRPFSEPLRQQLDRFAGEVSLESRFLTMARDLQNPQSRLVQVRGVQAGFPYYGEPVVVPAEAWRTLRSDSILIDQMLALQWGVSVGDRIQIGAREFELTGILHSMPGESLAGGLFVPRVWIAYDQLVHVGLLGYGSVAQHYAHLRAAQGSDMDAWRESMQSEWELEKVRVQTPASRSEEMGTLLGQMESYLSLFGLAALLLGAIGLISATHVYLKSKHSQIVLLRCMGVPPVWSLLPFLLQMIWLGIIAASGAVVIGLLGQAVMLPMLSSYLPVTLEARFAWSGIIEIFVTGAVVFLFCTAPVLVPLRKLSPLAALRKEYTPMVVGMWKDRWLWRIWAVGAMGLIGLTFHLAPNGSWAFWFLIAALFLWGVLYWSGRCLLALARSAWARKMPFVWRHGVANLHRPGNRTLLQVVILGIGGVLLITIHTASHLLLQQTVLIKQENDPDMIFFDIQPDQTEGFYNLVTGLGYSVDQLAPLVTARLAAVNGQNLQQIEALSERKVENWALHREYRMSWRDHMVSNERLTEGEWVSSWDGHGPAPVSVAQRLMEALDLKMGDRLVFDIQGVPVETYVANVRWVEWRRIQTNFFVIFPSGVLEEAPRFYIASVHSGSPEHSVRLQQAVSSEYPNISQVSLNQVIAQVHEVVNQASWILNGGGMVAIGTGIMVLIGALFGSRQERQREMTLWRLLGLEGSRIRWLLAIEYVSLGVIVALAAVCISFISGAALAWWVFKTPVSYPWEYTTVFICALPLMTLLLGWLFGGRMRL